MCFITNPWPAPSPPAAPGLNSLTTGYCFVCGGFHYPPFCQKPRQDEMIIAKLDEIIRLLKARP